MVENKDAILNKIWLTSRTRMISEERFRGYQVVSNILLSYYSLMLIFYTIIPSFLPNTIPLEAALLVLAAGVFSVSLIVQGFRFGETAQNHRECYLRLQRLYDNREDEVNIQKSYHEIISGYPNHRPSDYDDFIVDRILIRKENIRGSEGIIKCTTLILCGSIFRKFVYYVTITILFTFPLFGILYNLVVCHE